MATGVGVVVQLKGYQQIERMLATLDKKVARKHISKSFRAGAKVIEKQAEANAPVGKDYKKKDKIHKGGSLKKSIRVKAFKRNRKGRIGFNVTTSGNDSLFQGDAFYGAFQELGYRVGKRNREVKRLQKNYLNARKGGNAAAIEAAKQTYDAIDKRTRVAPKLFMRRAYQSHGKQATSIIERELLKGVMQEAKAK